MAWKTLVGCLAIGTMLSGCENADGSKGEIEGPIWHKYTPQHIKMEYFRKKCEGFGFTRGTEAMATCLKDTVNSSEAKASARMSSAMSDLGQQSNPTVVYQPKYSTTTYTPIYRR
ncbi:hypothetical protein N9H06_05330 [Planktomarina temperata]|nr:hypothetical protein [Planktomarina temperata]